MFVAVCVAGSLLAIGAVQPENKSKIGIVNFKTCAEESKTGKQELARINEMEKQLQNEIETKQKEINEVAPKLSEEYTSTLTPEAEAALKEKFNTLNREYAEMHNSAYSKLSQFHQEIVQKLADTVTKAAQAVAKQKGLEAALHQEACFYFAPELDITSLVIAQMDAQAVNESK